MTEADRSSDETDWLLSRSRRLNNYMILKIGIFAIASVYGAADFVNAGTVLRIIYVIVFLLLIFYIYLFIDTRKFLKKIETKIKSQQ